jgi:hypothetical protein
MPPARASGDIRKKGTAEVTTLILFGSCALADAVTEIANNKAATVLSVLCFITFRNFKRTITVDSIWFDVQNKGFSLTLQ